MEVDFSKIPTTCRFNFWTSDGMGYGCKITETVRGRTTEAHAFSEEPQEAVNKAVHNFLGYSPIESKREIDRNWIKTDNSNDSGLEEGLRDCANFKKGGVFNEKA